MTTAYDQVRYPSLPIAHAHPDRLAVVARLHGLETPAAPGARVLELGCGNASHLLPMAVEYPNARFVGVDLASSPIAEANETIAMLGLANIRLHALSVMDFGGEFGEFDYILAHGLYSWVPDFVRQRLLEVCGRHLSANGVAYISFNAYPGGYQRQMLRSMMRFHTREIEDPREKLRESMSFLAMVAECHPRSDSFEAVIREELKRYSKMSAQSIYHDDLGEVNDPESIWDFAEKARAHGLRYLAEADHYDNSDEGLSEDAVRRLDELAAGDPLLREQYRDMLRNRKFRQTLLCRAECGVKYPASASRLGNVWVSTLFRPSGKIDYMQGAPMEFREREKAITLGGSFPKAVMTILGERSPQTVSLPELIREANGRIPEDAAGSNALLADYLFTSAQLGIVDLRAHEVQVTAHPGARPCVNPYVRLQSRRTGFVTTQRHVGIEVEGDLALALLGLLDGQKTRAELLAALREQCPAANVAESDLNGALESMARFGLLTA